MSYKVYNYSLEFNDCQYNDGLKTRIADLLKSIDSGRAPMNASYKMEVSLNTDGTISTKSESEGLTDDQKKMFDGIIQIAQEVTQTGGKKSKIKNEVQVEKEL